MVGNDDVQAALEGQVEREASAIAKCDRTELGHTLCFQCIDNLLDDRNDTSRRVFTEPCHEIESSAIQSTVRNRIAIEEIGGYDFVAVMSKSVGEELGHKYMVRRGCRVKLINE